MNTEKSGAKGWRCTVIIMILLLFTAQISYATTEKSTIKLKQRHLNKLNVKIKKIQKDLIKAQKTRSTLEQKLQTLETQMSAQVLSLRQLKPQIKTLKTELQTLHLQLQNYRQTLSQNRQQLRQQLQIAYLLKKQNYWRLLLNQQDPTNVQRMLYYFRYLNTSAMNDIKDILTAMAELQIIEQQTDAKSQQLQTVQQQKNNELKKLQTTQQQRKKLLRKINRRIKTNAQRLQIMQGNKTALEMLIRKLKTSQKYAENASLPFKRQRGHLPWPVKGRIIARFGSPIGRSKLRYAGVLIRAKTNTPVHAIYGGRVMFAHWLKGFGLLLIIDHNDGYMTLYGRNHSLYVQTGDRVYPGEEIAAVGRSGGFKVSALYFALRHRGNPLNPVKWCKPR